MSKDSGTKKRRARWPLVVIALLLVAGAGILVLGKLKGRTKVAFEKGRIHLRSGNAAAAAEQFRAVLARYPDSTLSLEYLVEALVADGRFSEAEQELSRAPQVGISKAEVALIRARLFVRRAEGRFRDTASPVDLERCDLILSEDVEPAIAVVEENAEDVEDPMAAYLFLGGAYELKRQVLDRKANLLKGDADLALELEEAAEADQKRVRANAASIAAQTAFQRAIGAYREAMGLAPDKPAPRLALANLLVTHTAVPGREQVGAILAPVIAGNPAHRQARHLLAMAEGKARNHDAALAHLAEIPGHEDDAETLYLKVWVLVDAGRWVEAVPLAEKLHGLRAADFRVPLLYGQALVGRAKLRQDAGQADAAQLDYRLAVDLLQNTLARLPVPLPAARFALGEALLAIGNRQQGISALTRGVQDVPRYVPTNRLARLELLRRHYEIRLRLAKELLVDDPEAAASHAAMAFNMGPASQEAFEIARAAALAAGGTPREVERLIVQHAAGLEAAGRLGEALAVCERGPGPAEMPRVAQKRAELLVRRGSYQEAVQAYEELREHATDSEPAYGLAYLYGRLGHPDKAQALYEELLAEDPGDKVAASRLAGLLAGQGKLDAARKLVTGDGARLDTSTTQALLLRLALGEGQMDEALGLAETLAESEPDEPATHFFLGMLLWARGQLDQARAAFDAALECDPDYRPAYQRGLVDLQQGRTREAVEFYRRARERFANDISSVVHLALALQADGQLDESVQLLRDLESALSMQKMKGPLLSWQLAVTESGAGDLQAALEHSDSAVHRYLGSPEDRRGMLERLAGLGDAERRSAAASLNLMIVLGQAGAVTAAVGVADRLEELLPGDPLVGCWRADALDTHQHAEGVEAYGQLIKAHPAFLFPRLLLARSHSRARDHESAILVLEQALAIASEEEAQGVNLILGGFHERVGHVDEALECYEAAGDLPAALNNRAYLLVTVRGDAEAALPLAERAVELARSGAYAALENPARHYFLARMLWEGGRPNEARAAFDTLLQRSPAFPLAYGRGLLDLQQGRSKEAVELFQQACKQFPNDPSPGIDLAVALQADGQVDVAVQVLTGLLSSPRVPRGLGDTMHWHLAVLEAHRGDVEAAVAHNAQVARSELGGREDRRRLLERLAAEPQERRREAAVVLSTLVAFSRANYLQPTVQAIGELQELLPDEPLPAVWHASVLGRLGRTEEAVAAYQAVIAAHPDLISPRVNLAQTHSRAGDAESAIAVLQDALARAPEEQAATIHLQLAQLHEGEGRIDMAVADYEAAMGHPAVAPLALNNLAYLLATVKGDLDAALPLAERAVELAPLPASLDTLGFILLQKGETERAVELLERARTGMPQTPTVRYHLGMAYLKAERLEEARAELEEALALSPDFPEADQARAELANLKD